MVKPIPKWVWKCYALLWKKFKNKPFNFAEANSKLNNYNRNEISVMFNELKNAGWISISLNDKDNRKRNYTLINPINIVENFQWQKI